MRKGCDVINGAGLIDLCLFFNGFCHVVDAADGWNDPDFIADTGLAIASSVPVKEALLSGGKLCRILMISIGKKISQACFHIMGMNPGALGDVLPGLSDGRAVLYNCLPCPDVLQGKLVTLGDIF